MGVYNRHSAIANGRLNMIYDPRLYYSFTDALGEAIPPLSINIIQDYLTGDGHPWVYYAGQLTGYLAAFSSIPGMALTIYAVGTAADILLFRSPDGSLVDLYLNGVLSATIDTYAPTIGWAGVGALALLPSIRNEIKLVNVGASQNPSATGVPIFGAGGLSVIGGSAERNYNMIKVSFKIRDIEVDGKRDALIIGLPDGQTLAQIETWCNAMSPLLEGVTGGVIDSVDVNIPLNVNTARTVPLAGHYNERGGLFTFETAGTAKEGVRVPAMSTTLMPAQTINTADQAVIDFVEAFTVGLSNGTTTVKPIASNDAEFVSLIRGVRSQRKG